VRDHRDAEAEDTLGADDLLVAVGEGGGNADRPRRNERPEDRQAGDALAERHTHLSARAAAFDSLSAAAGREAIR
jgi:hypothetical protein